MKEKTTTNKTAWVNGFLFNWVCSEQENAKVTHMNLLNCSVYVLCIKKYRGIYNLYPIIVNKNEKNGESS